MTEESSKPQGRQRVIVTDPNDLQTLESAAILTQIMRDLEVAIIDAGKTRRKHLRNLRERGVPFRVIAESTGLTQHAIYKDLRWGK